MFHPFSIHFPSIFHPFSIHGNEWKMGSFTNQHQATLTPSYPKVIQGTLPRTALAARRSAEPPPRLHRHGPDSTWASGIPWESQYVQWFYIYNIISIIYNNNIYIIYIYYILYYIHIHIHIYIIYVIRLQSNDWCGKYCCRKLRLTLQINGTWILGSGWWFCAWRSATDCTRTKIKMAKNTVSYSK